MVTFSLSVALIYLWDYAMTRPAPQGGFLVLAALPVLGLVNALPEAVAEPVRRLLGE